jgi:hypothetical protein
MTIDGVIQFHKKYISVNSKAIHELAFICAHSIKIPAKCQEKQKEVHGIGCTRDWSMACGET